MGNIPNDCFAAPEEMITTEEAIARIKHSLCPVTEIETISLDTAVGRLMAKDIKAPLPLPPFNNSAVDGYAFKLTGDHQPLQLVGRSAAGLPFGKPIGEGECVKIFTGAVIPDGADTVAMLEDCKLDGELVSPPPNLQINSNIREAGEDINKGEAVLKSGTRLRPMEIARLASLGYATVAVFQKLKIGILSTGDELIEPGKSLASGQIYDSNRYLLKTLFKKLGADVIDFGIIKDNPKSLQQTFSTAAKKCHMIISSGGISTGDEDHVKQSVQKLGKLDFWRIAIKPGRPLALGTIDDSVFLGLPGNPVAALVCAVNFGFTIANRLMGADAERPVPYVTLPAAFEMKKKAGRREWLRGRYITTQDGITGVKAYHSTGSALISSLTWANGLIEIPEEITEIKEGMPVRFIPFGELFE